MTLTLDKRLQWFIVTTVGCVAFAFIRMRAALPFPHYGALGIVATVAFAILQEAVFRGFLYRQFERFGPATAIIGTSALFAVFHLPRYGPGVLAVDFAAGLLFGWQRWTTGSWSAPALTHIVANLVQL